MAKNEEQNPPNSHDEKSLLELLKLLPQFFIGVTGFLYLTGFLILSSHLGRLGIKEGVGGDVFRLRYIEVGILYCIPYIVFLLPILLFVRVYNLRYESLKKELDDESLKKELDDESLKKELAVNEKKSRKMARSRYCAKTVMSCIAIVSYFLIFLILLFFAPHKFIGEEHLLVLPVCFVPIVGFFLLAIVDPKMERRDKWSYIVRIILLALTVIPLIILLSKESISSIISDAIITYRASLFFFFIVLIGALYFITLIKITNSTQKIRASVVIVIICIYGFLYYLNVIAFAASIYPFIPSYRGGGDYSETSDAILWFRDNYKPTNENILSIPKALRIDGSLKSKKVKIIYDTSGLMYIANSKDSGGPRSWRKGTWPVVYGIRKDSIAGIEVFWESPKFSIGEFSDESQIDQLCEKLNSDTIPTHQCTIEGLNNILQDPELYTKIVDKHFVQLPKEIIQLIDVTAHSRKMEFSMLKKVEQNQILELNRRLMELIYYNTCPKSLYLQR